uniref:Uncharacterized protein n=1 Tax=Cucumis melo TaxID=3656 RepID=A0A9I9ELH7_CUCME
MDRLDHILDLLVLRLPVWNKMVTLKKVKAESH